MKNLFNENNAHKLLSPREKLILNAVKNQLTQQEIANNFNIPPITVTRHLLNITDKIHDTDKNLALQLKQNYNLKAQT